MRRREEDLRARNDEGPAVRALVQSNPAIAGGRAVVRGRGILTAVLLDRWLSGESVEHIAYDYALRSREVEAAIHYELGRIERNKGRSWREVVAS